jgi:hypothetical protein
MSTSQDPRVNNEQKDEPPVPLALSRAKYVILRWMVGILLLVAASALWWWPRYVAVHPKETHAHLPTETKTDSHSQSSAERATLNEEQGVSARLAAMEEKLQALEKKSTNTILEGGQVQSVINPEIWTELKGTAEQKVAVLKDLFKIERAIQQGRPFQAMLQTVKSKASWLESVFDNLGVLESVAEGGAPTLRHLQEQFEESEMKKTPLFEAFRLSHIIEAFLSLIHIEKISDNTESDHQETQKLRSLMDAGDVAAVVKSIDELGSSERHAYDAWLMQAKLYLDVQEAFDTVLAEVVTEAVKITKSVSDTPKDNQEIHAGVSQ